MLLKELHKPESYIYIERYINKFKKVANEVSQEYCAINGLQSFLIPHEELSQKETTIFLSNPTPDIYKEIISNGKVIFYHHPDMTENQEFIWEKIVSPTSSTRTVIPQNKKYAIKLHLDKRLSKYIRRLRPDSVEHSILISKDLENSCPPKNFGFLPETIGIAYRGRGMIIRELAPRPRINEDRILIPLFSLYAPDLKNKEHKPFLIQLVKSAKEEPLIYFIEMIIKPLFEGISYFIKERGLFLEAHGQNVLVELTSDFKITRFIHRDFQSIYIDQEIRKEKKLEIPFKKHIMGIECPKEVSYSLVYDQFIGEYVLTNFVEILQKEWNISPEKTAKAIKNAFTQYFDSKLFPKECYYLLSGAKFNNNETEIVCIKQKPRYRQ